jgi:hypothetical protein
MTSPEHLVGVDVADRHPAATIRVGEHVRLRPDRDLTGGHGLAQRLPGGRGAGDTVDQEAVACSITGYDAQRAGAEVRDADA